MAAAAAAIRPSAASFSAAISGASSPAGSEPVVSSPATIALMQSSEERIRLIPAGVTGSDPSR
ncbi:hypothetical protein ROS9278_03507 [Roseomonas sp. CECT 9278]|nr:hypothetical protein ROS9278_03507 [Roseomonas sp. CECT 9278]